MAFSDFESVTFAESLLIMVEVLDVVFVRTADAAVVMTVELAVSCA